MDEIDLYNVNEFTFYHKHHQQNTLSQSTSQLGNQSIEIEVNSKAYQSLIV